MSSFTEQEVLLELERIKNEEKARLEEVKRQEEIRKSEEQNRKRLAAIKLEAQKLLLIEKFIEKYSYEVIEKELFEDKLKTFRTEDESINYLKSINFEQFIMNYSNDFCKCNGANTYHPCQNHGVKFTDVKDKILNKLNLKEKYSDFVKNKIQEYETLKKERLKKEEQDRKEVEEKELNETFDKFIKSNCVVPYQILNVPYDGSSYIHNFDKYKNHFEEMFWKYIDKIGGFAKCPTCCKIPIIHKSGFFRFWNEVGNGSEKWFTGLLTNKNEYNYCIQIKHISCCEHLFDWNSKQRYICLNEKLRDLYKNKQNEISSIMNRQYVKYNPEDPYGEKAFCESEIKRLTKIAEEALNEIQKYQDKLEKLQNGN